MGRDRPRSGQGGAVAFKLCGWRGSFASRGRRSFERGYDAIHHPAQISPNVACPESHHPIALPAENPIPNRIVRGLGVVAVL
jgi:hypothetical protein